MLSYLIFSLTRWFSLSHTMLSDLLLTFSLPRPLIPNSPSLSRMTPHLPAERYTLLLLYFPSPLFSLPLSLLISFFDYFFPFPLNPASLKLTKSWPKLFSYKKVEPICPLNASHRYFAPASLTQKISAILFSYLIPLVPAAPTTTNPT
jgi:hypothetical protein